MELTVEVNESRECFYEIDGKKLFVARIFCDVGSDFDDYKWIVSPYNDDFENDFFSNEPFSLQEHAVKHVDETMKDIFKRILDEP